MRGTLETGKQRHSSVILSTLCKSSAINLQQVIGQIQGGLVQSVGYAVMENFIEKEGRVLTPGLSTYLVPTVLDIPAEMIIMVLENPDPRDPWGARGMGEVMNMCLAPAVTAAVYDATGVWFDHFPLPPEEMLNGIAQAHKIAHRVRVASA